MKTTVLSDGAWGTAVAKVLCENNHDVTLWGPFADNLKKINASRQNEQFLPGIELPENLNVQENITTAVTNAEIIVLASPSQYLRGTLGKLKSCYKKEQILVNLAKGIEIDSLLRMSELTASVLGECSYCVLSGPSHAEEVARQMPTAVVAASENANFAKIVQENFMNKYLRVYTTVDVVSVELGGALKNVFAIAAGVLDGMGLGDNSKAALMTRGLAEMARLGIALGGRYETFAGLSGIGDLIVTCGSLHSRNRHVGEELGKGKDIDSILNAMGMVVAEGVKTAKSAYNLASKHQIETPIITEIYSVLYEGKSSKIAINDLMTRKARTERDEDQIKL